MKKALISLFLMLAIAMVGIPKDLKAQENGLQETYNPQPTLTAEQQEQQWSSQLIAYSKTLVGKRTGQCVVSLRKYFGVQRSEVQGMARNTKANSQTPKVGSVIILNMSRYGHIGLIIKTEGDVITYFDSNGNWTQRGAIRTIKANDKRIRGYRII